MYLICFLRSLMFVFFSRFFLLINFVCRYGSRQLFSGPCIQRPPFIQVNSLKMFLVYRFNDENSVSVVSNCAGLLIFHLSGRKKMGIYSFVPFGRQHTHTLIYTLFNFRLSQKECSFFVHMYTKNTHEE